MAEWVPVAETSRLPSIDKSVMVKWDYSKPDEQIQAHRHKEYGKVVWFDVEGDRLNTPDYWREIAAEDICEGVK